MSDNKRKTSASPKRSRTAEAKAKAAAEAKAEAAAKAAAAEAAEAAGEEEDDEEDDTSEYVTFALGDELFAFPMERVQEIIRMPETVKVPLAPPSLEGLANLRSRVLPVVSLRACCGYDPAEVGEATRVIVVDCGVPLGFIVDRVAAVVATEPDQVEPADAIQGTVDSRMLEGVIKAADGAMLSILDVQHVVDQEFRAVAQSLAANAAASGALDAPARDDDEEGDDDTFEMVSFVVDGQEYALPIDEIQEIVQASDAVSRVPNADSRVVGVMDLRGRLLPLVSLRRVFGLDQAELDESSRIVVVPLQETATGAAYAVGVVMDTVREVLRVPRELVDDLPGFVARDGSTTEIESVCRLEDGNRLVSVMSAERLFGESGLRAAIEAHYEGDQETAEMTSDEVDLEWDDDDDQLVVFRVDGEEYCLSVDAVQEIIRVPEQLIHVPKSLDFVEGLVNLRGSVLPVIDLRSRLGLLRGERDDLQRIVVVIIDGVRTGFIVDAVAEVLKLPADTLEQTPELSEEQAALISRVANLTEAGRMLLVLDHAELLGAGERDAIASAAPEALAA
jgi:purine-binding chemotaxis protein CheW